MPKDSRPLPPLNALRAFEATARHLSVKEAASELCVTPGAVSQLLKSLEQHYGVRLFNRGNRSIALTDAGQTLLPSIRNAFKLIASVSERVSSAADTGILTISATQFFAASWLIPRMHVFKERYPETDLRIVTQHSPTDFSRTGIDVAVRHGLGDYPGYRSDYIAAIDVVPVAARQVVERLGVPKRPEELLRWPLVHDASRKAWHRWFESRDIAETGVLRGSSFDDPSLIIRAVVAGEGAALLPPGMFAQEEAEGVVVRLAQETLLEDFAYYLVYPERALARSSVAAFRQWILDDETKRLITSSNKSAGIQVEKIGDVPTTRRRVARTARRSSR